MTEVSTILGGEDNVEQAILTLVEKVNPEIIGLCTTGLTETRGDDMEQILRDFRKSHPHLNELPILLVSSPDFKGALQDGYAAAVESMVRQLPQKGEIKASQVNILMSSAFTPGDLQEVKEIVSAFGLTPILIPDLSASLDGHLDDSWSPITGGGSTLKQLREMGSSAFTIAIGESMRGAAEILDKRFAIPYELFTELTGLDAVDNFLQALSDLSGVSVPEKYRRQRRQLQDAMLDTHFFFGRKRVSLALEPDQLYTTANFMQSMGAEIQAAVTTTRSPLLEKLKIEKVIIGDLEDFEQVATGSDLLIGNSNVKTVARKLNIPLYRQGIPIFDRLGIGQFNKVGYRGTMRILFDIGNVFLEQEGMSVKHAH